MKMRTLVCCCCGESTRGEQWHNRDTGYGMCSKCIAWIRERGMPESEIHELYGVEGINFPSLQIGPNLVQMGDKDS